MQTQDALSNGHAPTAAPALADADFRALVAADVRGQLGAEAAAMLRRAENLTAWRDVLADLVTDIMAQQTQRRSTVQDARGAGRAAYRSAVTEHARWSSDVARFRASVETRLREAKRLIRERDTDRGVPGGGDIVSRMDVAEWNIARLNRAVKAIADHVKATAEVGQ